MDDRGSPVWRCTERAENSLEHVLVLSGSAGSRQALQTVRGVIGKKRAFICGLHLELSPADLKIRQWSVSGLSEQISGGLNLSRGKSRTECENESECPGDWPGRAQDLRIHA